MEIFDILTDYFTVFQAACITILIAVMYYIYSGKWKSVFNSKCGMAAAALAAMGILYICIYPPGCIAESLSSIWHVVLIVLFVVIGSVMLYRTVKTTPLFEYLTNQKKMVSPGSKKWRLIYMLLSPYERVQLVLSDAKRTLDSDPYRTYKLLKSQKIDSWRKADREVFDKLMAASLLYLGAIKAAKGKAEKLHEKNSDDMSTCSILCTIYAQMGKVTEMKMMANRAYHTMIAESEHADYQRAQVYNNYACALILERRTDLGLDIAKKGMETALKENNMSMLHLTTTNYLKLLLRYKHDSGLIDDVLKRYLEALGKPENTCIEYINCQLMLIHNGYQKKNLEKYISTIFWANLPNMQGEEKCFFCLSCINVAWSHSVDVGVYLDDLIKVLKHECKELKTISKVRFYHQLMPFVLNYPAHCGKNGFKLDKRYNEIEDLARNYLAEEAVSNIEKALSETDSVCINLKCELRRILIDVKRQLGVCSFDEIMELHRSVFREYEAEENIMEMLQVVLQEIDECVYEIQISSGAPMGFLQPVTDKKSIVAREQLQQLNQRAESLLDQIDAELKKGDFYIRLAKGYCIAGDVENARRCLEQHRLGGCPETWLTEWIKCDYYEMQRVLGE